MTNPPKGWNQMPLGELEVVLWGRAQQNPYTLVQSKTWRFVYWLDESLFNTTFPTTTPHPWAPVARRYLMLLAKQRAQTLALLDPGDS